MQELVSLGLIGISLSMDTFSLSLSLGTLINEEKKLLLFPFVVGLFHFIFPLVGIYLGFGILNIIKIASNILLGIVLLLLGITSIIGFFNDYNFHYDISIYKLLILAFSVSFDSLTVGLGIGDVTTNYLYAASIFATLSLFFTYMGLIVGKYSTDRLGKYAEILAIIILLLLGLFHLIF